MFFQYQKRGSQGEYVAYLGTGSYQVQLAGFAPPPGPDDVQVSSADNVSLSYCTTAGWSVGLYKTVNVLVDCYDASGNAADTFFSFLYQSRAKPFGSANKG